MSLLAAENINHGFVEPTLNIDEYLQLLQFCGNTSYVNKNFPNGKQITGKGLKRVIFHIVRMGADKLGGEVGFCAEL